jgi:hypothetical protein
LGIALLVYGALSLVGTSLNPQPQAPNGGVAFVFFGWLLMKNNREP